MQKNNNIQKIINAQKRELLFISSNYAKLIPYNKLYIDSNTNVLFKPPKYELYGILKDDGTIQRF